MDPGIAVGNLGQLDMRDVTDLVIDAKLSWSMDGVSQLSFSFYDENFEFCRGNYFQLRRDVVHGFDAFTIASVRVEQSQGKGPIVNVEARNISAQLMKLDKTQSGVSAASATEYAQIWASIYGLGFQGEYTPLVPNITPATGATNDDNVWSVLQSLASETSFVCFISNNILFFASEKWLLNKYGLQGWGFAGIGLFWPDPPPGWTDLFQLIEIPSCYRSDDDPYAAEFSAKIDRTNGTQLRPGMTVYLEGIPMFTGQYLITEVQYDWRSPDPVSVTCRTPARPKDSEGDLVPEFRNALQ